MVRAEGNDRQKETARLGDVNPLSVLAHELKSPLATSRTVLAMLLDGDLGPLSNDQREYIARVSELGDYMIDLVTSWADMERLSGGAIQLELELHNLETLVGTAARELAPLAEKRGRSIEVVRHKPWPMVLVDPLRMQQILINLLDNAVRHGAKDQPVVVRCRTQGAQCVMTVHDASPGSHDDRLAMVAALGTAKRRPSSASLGLRIAKLLAQAHGGDLRLDPHATAGTSLHLHLPLAKQLSLLDE